MTNIKIFTNIENEKSEKGIYIKICCFTFCSVFGKISVSYSDFLEKYLFRFIPQCDIEHSEGGVCKESYFRVFVASF